MHRLIQRLFTFVAVFCIVSTAHAYTPYDSDLTIARCVLIDRMEKNHPSILAFNAAGIVINQFGASDEGRFASTTDAEAALQFLRARGICPEG